MEKAKVYFMKDITPENIIKAYEALGKELPGKVAVKMHSGEQGNQNYLRPEFAQRYIYGRTYKKETWKEYCEKRNINFS